MRLDRIKGSEQMSKSTFLILMSAIFIGLNFLISEWYGVFYLPASAIFAIAAVITSIKTRTEK